MTGFASRGLIRAAVFAMLASTGCYSNDNGLKPPGNQLYYPTGLAVSPGGSALYVANSDFDLQYTGGTLQVYDLEAIRQAVPHLWDRLPGQSDTDVCGKIGVANATMRALDPTPCGYILTPPKHSVETGAFAADAKLVVRPRGAGHEGDTGARLMVPVRGDPSLTWVDVDDDRDHPGSPTFAFDCGQAHEGEPCSDAHKAGIDPTDNSRQLLMPGEPIGLAVSDDASAVVVTHQTAGAVSLFTNAWPGDGGVARPVLTYVEQGLSTGAYGIATIPTPGFVEAHRDDPTIVQTFHPSFFVTYRTAAEIDVISVYGDEQAAPARPFLQRTGATGFSLNNEGFDSRGVAVDARPRLACEASCNGDDGCLQSCAGQPIGVYVANRTPPSLLVGKTTTSTSLYGTYNDVQFYDQIVLSTGASQVVMGSIVDVEGKVQSRVFVVCFDARTIYVYDPGTNTVESVVLTGRGPSAIAFDPAIQTSTEGASFAYVAHFTDSYIGVLDVDRRHPSTYMTFVGTVGSINQPREATSDN